MYFWTYNLKKKNEGTDFFKDHWLHERPYKNAVASVNKARKKAQKKKNDGQIEGKKRINHSTNKPYVMGEEVQPGKLFSGYERRFVDKDGYFIISVGPPQKKWSTLIVS